MLLWEVLPSKLAGPIVILACYKFGRSVGPYTERDSYTILGLTRLAGRVGCWALTLLLV